MRATRQHRVRTGELKRHIVSSAFDPLLPRHLENDLQLDWSAERKTCDAIHQAAGALVFSKDVLQQLRSGVSDFGLIADISRSGHRHAEPDDPGHFVERSQMLPRDSEDVERREVSRLAPRFHIELRADTPNEFRPVALRGKHPAQKKQIARLHRFHIGAERLRRRRELDAKVFQPLLGAGRPSAFARYHLPACAPPSTCNISPVVKVASVRNRMASTTSWISPILPTGCNSLRNSYVSGLCIGVLMTPNATVFTRMPSLAYSIASALVTASKPPLIMICSAAGTPTTACPTRVVETLTMLPLFCRNICFTANWETWRNPASVVETKALKSSVVYSVKGFGMNIPALFISTSTRPNRDKAVSTIFVAVFGSPMSPSTSARFADAGNGFALLMFREFATTL